MSIFQVRLSEAIPHDMDPEIRADHRARHRTYLRELRSAGVLRNLWRIAGTRDDLAVLDVSDATELHTVLTSMPLFSYLDVDVTAVVEHPDLEE